MDSYVMKSFVCKLKSCILGQWKPRSSLFSWNQMSSLNMFEVEVFFLSFNVIAFELDIAWDI